MYCGIINSVTKWHLVGYCYWVILRCTDPWILNLPLWSPKVKNLWWYTSNPPTYHHDTGTVPIPFGGLSAEHMPKFSLVTTQPPQRGGTKKNLNASLWTRNSAVCTSAASTPEYRTSHFLCKHGTVYNIICIMTSTDSYTKGIFYRQTTAERWHHRSPLSNDVVSTTAGNMAITKHMYLLEKQDLTIECLHRIVIYRGILQLT